jgi:hypothetical protein
MYYNVSELNSALPGFLHFISRIFDNKIQFKILIFVNFKGMVMSISQQSTSSKIYLFLKKLSYRFQFYLADEFNLQNMFINLSAKQKNVFTSDNPN